MGTSRTIDSIHHSMDRQIGASTAVLPPRRPFAAAHRFSEVPPFRLSICLRPCAPANLCGGSYLAAGGTCCVFSLPRQSLLEYPKRYEHETRRGRGYERQACVSYHVLVM